MFLYKLYTSEFNCVLGVAFIFITAEIMPLKYPPNAGKAPIRQFLPVLFKTLFSAKDVTAETALKSALTA